MYGAESFVSLLPFLKNMLYFLKIQHMVLMAMYVQGDES